MLRVAIAGCGRISDLHALGYRGLSDAAIHGLFDLDRSRAEAKARAWGVGRVYSDYQELLDDPEVDLVEILTPHHLHCAMTCAAAAAGKHVSVQKPMALDLAEADRMLDAARQAGVVLRVYENFVFYPPLAKAKELLRSGAIGEPVSLNLRVRTGSGAGAWAIPGDAWAWRFDPATCGGGPVMFDHGYHNFSLVVDLFGLPESVAGWIGESQVFPGSGLCLDAPAMVMWSYGSGSGEGGRGPGPGCRPAFGVLDVVHAPELAIDTAHYADEARLEITGTRGVIFVNRVTGRLQSRPPLELYRDGVTTAFEHLPAGWEDSFVAATRDLVDALAGGRPSALTGERGREVLAFTLAAHQAAREGRVVALDRSNSGTGSGQT